MPASRASTYEIFMSYARKDNAGGLVTAIRDHILQDHRRFSTEPLRIFLDLSDIRDLDDWRHRILGALRISKILLICLSPNYFASPYCHWEFDEYLKRQVHHLMGSDTLAQVYFVEVPNTPEQHNASGWYQLLRRTNYTDIRAWFPEGALALQREEVRQRMAALGQSLWERLQRARRAQDAPGNLRRQNPHFVGRTEELRKLHEHLGLGAVGVVTALHGLGGQGKTELAVAYAHAWADCYPAGLWALGAEGKRELLPLLGELAWEPALGFTPSEAQRANAVLLGRGVVAHLEQRAMAAREHDPERGGAALILLDNVTEAGLLSSEELATLPGAEWLKIVATTRLGMEPRKERLFLLAVDSLDEESALTLLREHQPPRDASGAIVSDAEMGEPGFASGAAAAAAREIVRALGGFTLAVEQVAVYLGLHPEVTPSAFLAGLGERGLLRADALVETLRSEGREGEILHRQKQLSLILEATLSTLGTAALTALQWAALLPPESVPWPWLNALTAARHPQMVEHAADEPDKWVSLRRRLSGLRLLTPGDRPELARLHRLVGAHLRARADALEATGLDAYLVERAWSLYYAQSAPQEWELDALLAALPHRLSEHPGRDLANATLFVSEKVLVYRSVPAASSLASVSHAMLARLASSDPANAAWQRDVSVSLNKLGGLAVAQGDLAAALRYFTQSLNIRERLASSDPANAEWQRDLSVSHEKLGDLAVAQGDLAAALRYFTQSLNIRERLASSDPANAEWQRDLSVSLNKLGDLATAQGDLAAALRYFTQSLNIRERLASSDPANAAWQRDLSVSLNKLGDLAVAQGDLPAALRYFTEALRIAERLASSDPANAAWQRDLWVSYWRLASHCEQSGRTAEAREWWRKAHDTLAGMKQRGLHVSPEDEGFLVRLRAKVSG